jgi:hypothetical protein
LVVILLSFQQQSYFSGEEYYRSKAGEDGVETQVEVDKVRNNDLFVRMDGGGNFGPHSQVRPIRSVGYLSLPPVLNLCIK